MNRIVIIEGKVSSLNRDGEEYSVTVEYADGEGLTLDVPPEAADQIGSAFREPVRVVVEIGAEELPKDIEVGGLANATREGLIREVGAARHVADEYRRENDALAKSNEGLREDFDRANRKTDEYANRAAELKAKLYEVHSAAFDPEKHITKATVAKWLEEDAAAAESEARYASVERSDAFQVSAKDTRTIIARINAHKDSP